MSDATDTWAIEARRHVYEDREFPFTQRDFQKIASIVHDNVGISLTAVKAPLVYSRLVRRLRSLGVESFKRYCALVETDDGASEREQMIAALTTNVTRFFREPHHFEHLKTKVLPGLVEGIRRGRRLRIWSAGCSSGEEPYSIALSLLSAMPDAMHYDVKVLATDVNKIMIDKGRTGIYSDAAIAPVSRQMRADWFTRERHADGSKTWQVGDALRTLVAFRELNLMDEWPLRQAYHVIFCRNVTIYFEDDIQAQLWNRLIEKLAPEGRLYVGHSERIVDSRLVIDGNTVYRLAGEHER